MTRLPTHLKLVIDRRSGKRKANLLRYISSDDEVRGWEKTHFRYRLGGASEICQLGRCPSYGAGTIRVTVSSNEGRVLRETIMMLSCFDRHSTSYAPIILGSKHFQVVSGGRADQT